MTAPPRSTRRLPHALEATLWSAVLLAWLLLWRFATPSNDDLKFTSRGGLPHGELTPQAVLDSLKLDLLVRNGRTADVAAQLIFSLGTTATWVTMALLCWGTSLAAWAWIRSVLPEERPARSWLSALMLLAAAALPLTVLAVDHRHERATLYFMSATVGYIGGLLLFFAAGTLLVSHWTGRSARAWPLWAALVLGIAGALHHEQTAVCLLALLLAAALLGSRLSWTRLSASVCLVIALCAMGRFLLPGFISHIGGFGQSRPGESALSARLESITKGAGLIAYFNVWAIIALVAATGCLAVGALCARRTARTPWPAVTLLTLTAGMGVGAWAWIRTSRTLVRRPAAAQPLDFLSDRLALLTLGSALIVGACMITLILLAAPRLLLAAGPLVAVLGFTLVAGAPGIRVSYFPAFFMLLLAAGMVDAAVRALPRRVPLSPSPIQTAPAALVRLVAAAVLAAFVAGGVLEYGKSHKALQANHAVWTQIAREFEEAEAGHRSTVTIRMPARQDFAGDWPEPYAKADERLRVIYGLDPSVKVVFSPTKDKWPKR